MFSGLARAGLNYDELTEGQADWLFQRWVRLAIQAKVHVLHFDLPPAVALERMHRYPSDGRDSWGRLNALRQRIGKWMEQWEKSSTSYTYINAELTEEAVVNTVLRALDLK